MNKVKSAILTFKVMKLMKEFLTKYRDLCIVIDDDNVRKKYDELVYQFLFENLKKGKK